MILIGELSLWVALLMAAWSAITSFAGGKTGRPDLVLSGERGIKATWVLLVAASIGFWSALLTHDFSFRYAAAHTGANLPAIYLFASFWAEEAGALLMWALVLSSCSALTTLANRHHNRELMPYVCGILALAMLVLVASMCFGANPYERLDWVPADGTGMNPRYQHVGMLLHPPILYLGFAALAIAFAFGVAAVLTRRLDEAWFSVVRRWSVASWFLLTVGMTLEMWWAYSEPVWSGYRFWNPIDNASLAPWMVLGALLRWMTRQAHEDRISRWSAAAVVGAFLLALPGAFLTRRGVLARLHANLEWPVRGLEGLALIAALAAVIYLVGRRLHDLRGSTDSVEGRASEPQVNTAARKFGRYITASGVIALLLGVGGSMFSVRREVRLAPGAVHTQKDAFGAPWSFTAQGTSRFQAQNRNVISTSLKAVQGSADVGLISSEIREYVDTRGVVGFEPSTKPGIRRSLLQDTYVLATNIAEDQTADLRIAFIPFAAWTWLGGFLIAIGGLMTMWPVRSRRYFDEAETSAPVAVDDTAVVSK